ncbi:hypothetical protein H2198_005115 [Neophaeococcomyces mojaviensis]|uniref:Uncharacterized protein n=1 Tax=Neophaeococcomyces mojaviensis TaxID=3383035 RepID=A0ACC3A6H1_9EURO|nr:hypothetical protein H2198_005115 [Knufia sp. JES_112]
MEGRCQCRAVSFTTPLEKPLKIYVCHCDECRFQSSSTYGLSLMFPAFEFPQSAKDNLQTWTRTTFEGREKKCIFCRKCGSRIAHYIDGQPLMTLKGCVDGLTKEMLDAAVHIWTKRAITPIPPGAEQWKEEPDDGTADKI